MAHAERLIEFYKGAKVSLLLGSGDFKAEFRYAGGLENMKAATLPAIRKKVEDTIVPGDFAKPFEAYVQPVSSYQQPEKVKVIGVRATPRGKFLVYEKADGTQLHSERLFRPTAEYEVVVAETAEARAAHEKTSDAWDAARRKLDDMQNQVSFGAAEARSISEEVAS